MNHLAIDTATEILSVALCYEGSNGSGRLVSVVDAGLRHTYRLMTEVDRLLREADLEPGDLDLVSCTRGPGSFTGLRIGMATAKGLAAAVAARRGFDAAPIVSVPTLEVMASAVSGPGALVLPVIDGKKGRFYGAAFGNGRRLTDDLDLAADELLDTCRATASGGPAARDVIVTGPHAAAFVAALTDRVNAVVHVDPEARRGWASALLELAERRLEDVGVDPVDQGPSYLRASDAQILRDKAAR